MEEFNSADILKTQDRKKRLAFLEVGLFEISFVLIIIIVLFGTLNYFNILSLSTLYPNTFGFLPHQKILNQNKDLATNTPTTISKQPSTINSLIPVGKVSASDTTKYLNYAKNNFAPPYFTEVTKDYVVEGFFAGYNNNNISIITANGQLDFAILNSTILNLYFPTAQDNSGNAAGFKQIAKADLITKQNLGKVLEIHYLTVAGSKNKQVNTVNITAKFPLIAGGEANFNKYYTYALNNFDDPVDFTKNPQSYDVRGILTSYTNNTVTLATSVGPMEFAITDKTPLRLMSTSGGSTITKDRILTADNIGKTILAAYFPAQDNSTIYPLYQLFLYEPGVQ